MTNCRQQLCYPCLRQLQQQSHESFTLLLPPAHFQDNVYRSKVIYHYQYRILLLYSSIIMLMQSVPFYPYVYKGRILRTNLTNISFLSWIRVMLEVKIKTCIIYSPIASVTFTLVSQNTHDYISLINVKLFLQFLLFRDNNWRNNFTTSG